MSKLENSWNLVEVSGRADDDEDNENVNIDADDVLSNSSSGDGDSSDINDKFESDQELIRDILGSKTSKYTPKKVSKLESPGSHKRDDENSGRYLKTWHIVFLTSMITTVLALGVQRYVLLLTGNASLESKDSNEFDYDGNAPILYKGINFINSGLSYPPNDYQELSTWTPSGRYYIDFDNHIAYPVPIEEQIGWLKYKTDLIIAWYTVKAKLDLLLKDYKIPKKFDYMREYFIELKEQSIRLEKLIMKDVQTCRKWTVENYNEIWLPNLKSYSYSTFNKSKKMSHLLTTKTVQLSKTMKRVYYEKIVPQVINACSEISGELKQTQRICTDQALKLHSRLFKNRN